MHVSLRNAGCFVLATTISAAGCLPNSDKDFDKYSERAAPFTQTPSDAGVFDAAPPPTEGVEGLYYAACLTFLAYGSTQRVFNFYTHTKFVPDASGGGTLTFTLKPLAVDAALQKPPATISEAGTVGDAYTSLPTTAPNVDATGRYTMQFGDVHIPGAANPITGRDITIENTVFTGHFGSGRSCAQLSGSVTKPVTLTLEPTQNTCIIVPIKDGDPTPTYDYEKDFKPGCQ